MHAYSSGTLSDAVEPGADPAASVDVVQDQFLDACAPAVLLKGLFALGPVHSTTADDVPLDDLKVDLEAWSVTGLDFPEVSIRVKPNDDDDLETFTARAEREQRKLEDAVRERGVALSEHSDSKTRRVLTALAAVEQP